MRSAYHNLPPELAAQLASADARVEKVAAVSAFLGVLLAVSAAFLPFATLDRLLDSGLYARWFFFGLGGGGILLVLGAAALTLWRRCTHPFHTVQLIEKHYGQLGDSLQGAVELCIDPERAGTVSAELCQAAVNQVAEQVQPLDFKRAVATSTLVRMAWVTACLAAVLSVIAFVQPKLAFNALARWSTPWKSIPRFTFVQLEATPSHLYVLRGEITPFAVSISPASQIVPATIRYRLDDGVRHREPLREREALLQIPASSEPGTLRIRAGDRNSSVRILPVPRPTLTALSARVRAPDYLGGAQKRIDCLTQSLNVVEGARVALSGKVLNPLASAWLTTGNTQTELHTEGTSFSAPEFATDDLRNAEFNWRDIHGFSPAGAYAPAFTVLPDAPPTVSLPALSRASAVLEEEALDLTILGRDDFGVRQITVKWAVQGPDDDEPKPTGERILETREQSGATETNNAFVFSATRLGIAPGSRVFLHAEAHDFKPGREAVSSETHLIFVLTREQHVRLLMRELDRLRSEMEDAVMAERLRLETNREIQRLDDVALDRDSTDAKISEQAEEEHKGSDDLKRLAEKGASLLAQALRNAQFPEEELAKWAEMLDAVRQAAETDLAEAAAALDKAIQSKGEQRRGEVEQAIAAQKKALKMMGALSGEMGEALAQLSVQTLADRFEAVAQTEKDLANTLGHLFGKTAGTRMDELPKPLRQAIERSADMQQHQAALAARFPPDLAQCALATDKEIYEQVAELMEKKNAVASLQAVSDAIVENRLATACEQLHLWSDTFERWAKMLRGDDDGGGEGAGQGGGGGEMPAEMMEFLIALLRVAEGEQALRLDTGALDLEKEQKDYARKAEALTERQRKLSGDLTKLKDILKRDRVARFVDRVADLMDVVSAHLSKPDTGERAQSAETAVVELLMTAFQKSNSKSSAGGQTSASLSMMAQKMMLGMSAGAQAGDGSGAGGGTGSADGGAAGRSSDDGLGKRSRWGHAADPSTFPAEYRDLLQIYFKRAEAERADRPAGGNR
ncbi:MAG: hypothetical protein KAI66_00705 [Lentisphaeria bacterium]|nr:hypothetical protein [Lentisphaeria bacterium]